MTDHLNFTDSCNLKFADSYSRLSDEEKRFGRESESISNQKEIIRDYCKNHGIVIVREFVDDGFSGGNFERPAFQEMLEHLKTGKVNMVITKDLSRLGRDMTESSYYAERYFPEHGIQYIAPGNDFDSMGDNLMAPFHFAMNDVYLRDTSRKIKQTFDLKRKQGKYACCPPYGYRKAARTTDKLAPDENTAPVVKRIFSMASAGISTHAIAKQLTAEGVYPPLKYRVECRDNFTPEGAARASDVWNSVTVKRILINRVYLGHTILGKTKKASVKSKRKVKVAPDDWVITENTHEPLVSQEQFDLAQHFLRMHTKDFRKHPRVRRSIFSGLAYCAHCGTAMCSGGSVYKGEREKYWYLSCNKISARTGKKCEQGARIKYYDLVEVVKNELNQLLSLSDEDIKEITERAVKKAASCSESNNKEKQLKNIETRLKHLTKMIERAYRDNAAEVLSDDTLDEMMSRFGEERKILETQKRELAAEDKKEEKTKDAYDKFFNLVRKYSPIEELDQEILHTFIEKIEVERRIYPDGFQKATHDTVPFKQKIRIFYRFIGELTGPEEKEICNGKQ